MMISFGNFDTEKIWEGIRVKGRVKGLPSDIQEVGRRKLRMINYSISLLDLRTPSSNILEKLSGNLKSFYSIRINDQWRIVFKWLQTNAHEVEIVDYH